MPKVKHRHSKARGRKRRTHYKAEAPSAVKCSQCGKIKQSHQVCPHCGYYKGTQVKKIETIEERKAKKEKKQKNG
ncbi:MAG: 50S ribosomal protein L32 [Candidatus Omnitrophota bacterium]|nr:50S ribosomal protein L32 [Candidatus Omnitrophota bacterium]